MTEEEQKLRKKYYTGVRRTKYFLRYMPRRSNIDRYPVIKWFANSARKRDYLWSFRSSAAAPAFYIGWILTLLPLIGFQILLGFFLALTFRANLMIVMGLQWVSNPLTAAPIWVSNYLVGNAIMRLFIPTHAPELDPELVEEAGSSGEEGVMEMLKILINSFKQGDMNQMAEGIFHFFVAICLGAIVIGIVLGFLSSVIYQFFARRNGSPLLRLRELMRDRMSREESLEMEYEEQIEFTEFDPDADSDPDPKRPDSH